MSVTISNKIVSSFGNKHVLKFDLVVGAYATNGVALTAATLGLDRIDLILCERKGGVLYSFNHSTNKIQAYRQSVATAGALSAPDITTTDGTVVITGGASGAGTVPLLLDPDSDSGALAMSAVTGPLSIPAATLGITPPTMALATGITFTGDSNSAAALSEVTNGVTLSDTVRCIAIGV